MISRVISAICSDAGGYARTYSPSDSGTAPGSAAVT